MIAEIDVNEIIAPLITAVVTALVAQLVNWLRSRPKTAANKLLTTAIEVGGDAITKAFVQANTTPKVAKVLGPAIADARQTVQSVPPATLRDFKDAVKAQAKQ